jgi:hypothetical protein
MRQMLRMLAKVASRIRNEDMIPRPQCAMCRAPLSEEERTYLLCARCGDVAYGCGRK